MLDAQQERDALMSTTSDTSSSMESDTVGVRPFSGEEYLESLRDGREIWIYGERVKDVTTHPAFRNTARMIACLYDDLHDPALQDVLTTETDTGSGSRTHKYFKAPKSGEEQLAARDAIAAWSRLTYGWLGRSPDYKASFLGTLGANAEFYRPFEANARAWYKKAQERVMYLNSSSVDFKNPELRSYLEKYVRGSNGYNSQDRVKLMKLLWDAIGTEFGSRHELYEINYAGSTDENRLIALNSAAASGLSDRMKAFADTCMAEYDLNGWTAPDLINNTDVSYLLAQLNK